MIEAILHLSDDGLAAIGLDDLVAAARGAGLRAVTELVCHGPGGIVLFRVDDPIPDDDLDRFESVVWWERLADADVGSGSGSDSGVTYLCKLEAPKLPDEFPADALGLAHDVSDVRTDGVDLSVVGSREDISRGVAAAGDVGMDLQLRRLSDYRGRPSTLDALTDRQREVVETAYAMGYYEVPRTASAEAVARELGVDPSTVTEHLQRAERNLLARVLGASAHLEG